MNFGNPASGRSMRRRLFQALRPLRRVFSQDNDATSHGRKPISSTKGQLSGMIPEGIRVYAVGDIHGCIGLLDLVHRAINEDTADDGATKYIVYLGDYIDRGPDSKGVINRLLHCVPSGFRPIYLKGNHDAALLDFLEDPGIYETWRDYGAPQTLMSYGVRPPLFHSFDKLDDARRALLDAIPLEHIDFLRALRLMWTIGDYVFVHAGVRPGVPLADQKEYDLLWIREEFHNSMLPFEKIVVHGHSPVSRAERLNYRIPVDTGAYATGILSCAVLEGETCRFVQATAK